MRGVLGLVRDHRVVIGVNYATLFVNASGARLTRARSSARRLTDGMRACAPVRRDAGARTRWHGASAVPGIQRDRRRPAAAFAPPVPVFTQGCRGQVSARAAWTCVLPAARSPHAKEQAPYRQRTSKSIKAASASRWKASGARSYEVMRRPHDLELDVRRRSPAAGAPRVGAHPSDSRSAARRGADRMYTNRACACTVCAQQHQHAELISGKQVRLTCMCPLNFAARITKTRIM